MSYCLWAGGMNLGHNSIRSQYSITFRCGWTSGRTSTFQSTQGRERQRKGTYPSNLVPIIVNKYSACCLVRPWMEELIPEKNSLEKIPKPLKRWMGRPQLLPEIVENVLRSLFWAAGSKQPSPCLQPPKVGGLLRHLLLLLKAPLTSLHF